MLSSMAATLAVLCHPHKMPSPSKSQDKPDLYALRFDDVDLDILNSDFLNAVEGVYQQALHPHRHLFGTQAYRTHLIKYTKDLSLALDGWIENSIYELQDDKSALDVLDNFQTKLTWILAGGIMNFPWVITLSAALPLFCPGFYKDLVEVLGEMEEPGIEVSWLSITTWISS